MPISLNYKEFTHLLFIIVTLHMPNCDTVVLLYLFNWKFMFLVSTNCSSVALGNNLLYRCIGNLFPSLPVSTLYGTIIETWLDDVFRLAVITDGLLLKIIEFIFTVSIWPSSSWCWSGSCSRSWMFLFLPLLQTSLKWLTLPHFSHFFPYTRHCLHGWLEPQ